MGRQIGYARVSTDDLHGKAQKAALEAVPCDLIFFEQESGTNRERPEPGRCRADVPLASIEAGIVTFPFDDSGKFIGEPFQGEGNGWSERQFENWQQFFSCNSREYFT